MDAFFSFGKKKEEPKPEEEEDDLVIRLMKKTGCMELHYAVQDCIAEKQDWRQCKEEVKKFRECMEEYNKKRQKELQ